MIVKISLCSSRDLAVREIPTVIETIASINEFEKLCYIADKLARDTGMLLCTFHTINCLFFQVKIVNLIPIVVWPI